MNPQSAALPAAPKMVNDVAKPVQAAPPAPAPAAPAASSPVNSGPSIVSNIPVHAPQAAAPANEDEELDKIMHDVGQELKKEEKKPEHHGLLGFLHHDPKPLVKVNNQATMVPAAAPVPAPMPMPAPAAAEVVPAAPVALPAGLPRAAATKPTAQRHIPFFVIFVVLCVTGFLIAAAIAAYRQT